MIPLYPTRSSRRGSKIQKLGISSSSMICFLFFYVAVVFSTSSPNVLRQDPSSNVNRLMSSQLTKRLVEKAENIYFRNEKQIYRTKKYRKNEENNFFVLRGRSSGGLEGHRKQAHLQTCQQSPSRSR